MDVEEEKGVVEYPMKKRVRKRLSMINKENKEVDNAPISKHIILWIVEEIGNKEIMELKEIRAKACGLIDLNNRIDL